MENNLNFIQDKITFETANKLNCEIVNPDHAGTNPPAIYTSQDSESPEHLNKLKLTISNSGEEALELIPWPLNLRTQSDSDRNLNELSYLRLDLSDFVNNEFQKWVKPSCLTKIEGAGFVRISKTAEQIGEYRELDALDTTEKSLWILRIIKKDNMQRLSLSDHFNFNPGDSISIALESVISFVRPSIRYLDTSWVNPFRNTGRVLVQNAIVLKRPSYFVGKPFPLEISWLDNHNVAYISKGGNHPMPENYPSEEFENELSFSISNKGLEPLRPDCREEVLEGPYFELVFLGGSGTGDATEKKYLKDIQLEIRDDSYGDEWTHHKMIQGPTVTWRIQPRLYIDGIRNKEILGIKERGTISFSIKQLKVFGKPGVSMLYLKYYNIPDFDNNQIVLYIEKKELKGSIPAAGFTPQDLRINSETNESFTPPLRWEIKELDGNNKTIVSLGDKVGIGTEKPEKELHVRGNMEIEGDSLIKGNVNIDRGNDQAYAKLQVRNGAIVPMEGQGENAGIRFKPDAFGGRGDRAFIEYYHNSGENTTLKIANHNDTKDHIVLDPGKGNVGIGINEPKTKLDIQTVPRTGKHVPAQGLYVTGNFGKDNKGIEFRHTNGTQGLGFGYNTIYATGSTPDQDVNLKPRGKGSVNVKGIIKAERFIGIKLIWGAVKTTEYLNSYDKVLDYEVPAGHVMVGIYSVHDNKNEDRRWKIRYRKISLSGV